MVRAVLTMLIRPAETSWIGHATEYRDIASGGWSRPPSWGSPSTLGHAHYECRASLLRSLGKDECHVGAPTPYWGEGQYYT